MALANSLTKKAPYKGAEIKYFFGPKSRGAPVLPPVDQCRLQSLVSCLMIRNGGGPFTPTSPRTVKMLGREWRWTRSPAC